MTPKSEDPRGALIARRDILRSQARACEEEIQSITVALRKLNRTDIYDEIITYLRYHPSRTFYEIHQALGGDRASLRTAVSLLKKRGAISASKLVPSTPFRYSVPAEVEEHGSNPLFRPHPEEE